MPKFRDPIDGFPFLSACRLIVSQFKFSERSRSSRTRRTKSAYMDACRSSTEVVTIQTAMIFRSALRATSRKKIATKTECRFCRRVTISNL
jgi:hypothetical protein